MEISPVQFTYTPREVMNPPSIDKNFDIKYLKEQSKIYEVEKAKIEPSDGEKEIEKGYPYGYYGKFIPVQVFEVTPVFPESIVNAIEAVRKTQAISIYKKKKKFYKGSNIDIKG